MFRLLINSDGLEGHFGNVFEHFPKIHVLVANQRF